MLFTIDYMAITFNIPDLNQDREKLDDQMQKISSMRNLVAHRKLMLGDIAIERFKKDECIFLVGTMEQKPMLINESKADEEAFLSIKTASDLLRFFTLLGVKNPSMLT